VLAAAWALAASCGALAIPEWHGFNVLHTAASRVGALDLGWVPGPGGKPLAQMLGGGVDLLWLLGADEFDTAAVGRDTFVVYQGHHGDRGAARADVILPGAAYTEKSGTWVNTEGRVQRGFLAVPPPGEAREDWAILRAFSAVIGKPLPYDDLDALRARLEQVNPVFGQNFVRGVGHTGSGPAASGSLDPAPFMPAVEDYYLTNPIARASAVMAECSKLYTHPATLQAAE
jgi:NADH-quinone oxidoreductase subunit G